MTNTPRLFVRMFQPRFAPLVESGAKRQTVRKTPVRIPHAGDMLSLREWTGKPYRSKHRELLRAPCRMCVGIELDIDRVSIIGMPMLTPEMREEFARKDGFEDWNDLLFWFALNHGFPFDGILIRW